MSTSKNSAGLAGVATSTSAATAPGLAAQSGPALSAHRSQGASEAVAEPSALFERFEWFPTAHGQNPLPAHMLATFAATVLDIARGAEAVLHLVEADATRAAHGDAEGQTLPALLDAATASDLRRLSIAALSLLANKAESLGDLAVQRTRSQGRAA